jgi:hypothetical protein
VAKLILPPQKFHLLSQVVLRRFCDARGFLLALTVQYPERPPRQKGPGAVCYSRDLKPDDPFAFEALWQPVENRVGEAIDAVENGTVFSDERLVDILRGCLAVHFARSLSLEQVVRSASGDVLDRSEARMQQDGRLISLSGIVPAGPEGRSLIARGVRDHIEQGGFALPRLIPERFIENYPIALERVAEVPVEIAVAEEGEFLIGDAPAQTLNPGRVGIVGGVPWDQATAVVMPLGRRHVMRLGKANHYIPVLQMGVDNLNRVQALSAIERVMWHPEADLADFVRTVRSSQ